MLWSVLPIPMICPSTQRKPVFLAGQADWNLLGFWDRAQVIDSEIQSEVLQLATDLMEQSGLIPVSLNGQVQTMTMISSVLVSGNFARKFRGRAIQHKRFFDALCTCNVVLKFRTTRSPFSISLKCAGGEQSQASCHQTNNTGGKGATEKWTIVAEYPTTCGMGSDVTDIVDAMYHHVGEYMHASDLRMDENHVGSPTDFHMWRLVQETTRSMYWNCPMKWLCDCRPASELWKHATPCAWRRPSGTTRTATGLYRRRLPCPRAVPPERPQALSRPTPGTIGRLPMTPVR